MEGKEEEGKEEGGGGGGERGKVDKNSVTLHITAVGTVYYSEL